MGGDGLADRGGEGGGGGGEGGEGGEGGVDLSLVTGSRLISGFDFSRAAMSHNQTIY